VRRGVSVAAAFVVMAAFLISLACMSAIIMEYGRLAEGAKRANEMVVMKESEDVRVVRAEPGKIEVYNYGSIPIVVIGYFKVNPAGETYYVKLDPPIVVAAASSREISVNAPEKWRVGIATSSGNAFWEEVPQGGSGGEGQPVPPGQTAYVAFAAEGLDSYASGSVVLKVDGQSYTYSDLPKTFAWVSGSTHSFEWASPVQGSGAKYLWVSTRGLSTKQSDNSFTVSANGYIIATYKAARYQLTTSVSPSGAGSVSLNPPSVDGYYDAGASVTATASASAGYAFTKWQLDGADYSTSNPTSIIMNAPHNLEAVFTLMTYKLTIYVYRSGTSTGIQEATVKVNGNSYTTGSDGKVQVAVTYGSHTVEVVSPYYPSSGIRYVFTQWSDGSTNNLRTVSVTSDTALTAYMKLQYYLTMQASPSGGGSVSPSSDWYDAGSTVQISATPNTGYAFASWAGLGSGSYTGTANPATVTVNGPITETANFIPWLTGWGYRRPVVVTSTNSLSNYQILVQVDTASLISAGKMRQDGGDIRFTDSDGRMLLSYWIESGLNTASTNIWVKVPSILAGSKTIYMYYGNPSATSQSSSVAVFGKSLSGRYTGGDCDQYYDAFILSSREWISGGADLGISGDDSGKSVTLPFTATIYGTSVSQVYLSTNGLLRWDNAADNAYSNSLDKSRKVLTAHWDDLYISTSDRSDAGVYQITGADGNLGQYIAYRWATTYYSSRSSYADFEIIIYKNGFIQFNIYQLLSSATPTEYICKGDGVNYIDLTSRWGNKESVLFVPRAVPEPTVAIGSEETC